MSYEKGLRIEVGMMRRPANGNAVVSHLPVFWSILALVLLLCVLPAHAGIYSDSPHGDPDSGVFRLEGYPKGHCAQCHEPHAGTPNNRNLFAANDNNLCLYCHDGVNALAPEHTMDVGTVYNTDGVTCKDCHDPHDPHIGGAHIQHIPGDASAAEHGPKLTSCFDCHEGTGGPET